MYSYKLTYVDGTVLTTKGTDDFDWLVWVKNLLLSKSHSVNNLRYGPWIKKEGMQIRLFYFGINSDPSFVCRLERELVKETSICSS